MRDTFWYGVILKHPDGSLELQDRVGIPLSYGDWDSLLYNPIEENQWEILYEEQKKEMHRYLPPTEKKPRKGYVYAVRCGNKLKLGRTINLKGRLKTYQKTSSVFRVIASKQVMDCVVAERTLLTNFSGLSDRNEWFEYSKDRARLAKELVEAAV